MVAIVCGEQTAVPFCRRAVQRNGQRHYRKAGRSAM